MLLLLVGQRDRALFQIHPYITSLPQAFRATTVCLRKTNISQRSISEVGIDAKYREFHITRSRPSARKRVEEQVCFTR